MRLSLLLLIACGAPATAPLAFRVTNHGPRAVVEIGGSAGDAGVTGTALLSDGESVTAPQGDVEVGTDVRLTVSFAGERFEAEPHRVELEGLVIAAERTDAGCTFDFLPAR